jgi:hypothetical protein
MADAHASSLARDVTKLLADLDFLFSVSRGPDGMVWTLGFDEQETNEKILVQMRFQENWLLIYHVLPAPTSLNHDAAVKLLDLNARGPISKVGLQESNIVIAAHLLASRLDAEWLKEAIGAVVALAAQVHVVLRKDTAH